MTELSRAKGSKLRNDRAELSWSSSRLLARALLEPERLDPLWIELIPRHILKRIILNFTLLSSESGRGSWLALIITYFDIQYNEPFLMFSIGYNLVFTIAGLIVISISGLSVLSLLYISTGIFTKKCYCCTILLWVNKCYSRT